MGDVRADCRSCCVAPSRHSTEAALTAKTSQTIARLLGTHRDKDDAAQGDSDRIMWRFTSMITRRLLDRSRSIVQAAAEAESRDSKR